MSLGSFYFCDDAHTTTDSYRLTSSRTRCSAAVSGLNMYTFHDLKGLDPFTLRTVHEQDLVVVRHERKNYLQLLLECYTAHYVICTYVV